MIPLRRHQLIIDGRAVHVMQGTTILDTALKASDSLGAFIPYA